MSTFQDQSQDPDYQAEQWSRRVDDEDQYLVYDGECCSSRLGANKGDGRKLRFVANRNRHQSGIRYGPATAAT